MQASCYFCKRGLKCPIHAKVSYFDIKEIKNVRDFEGASPPSVFIGSKLRYPSVNIGVLTPINQKEDVKIYDDQRYWSDNNVEQEEIISLRQRLINSRTQVKVKGVLSESKILGIMQEIGMGVKQVGVDIKLKKNIKVGFDYDKISLPIGNVGSLDKIEIENIKIPSKIQKVYDDIDLKAVNALHYLYKNEFDEQKLSQILSVGVLGLKKDRKLVPTRFSITAVDDSIGKSLIKDIKDYKILNDYLVYFGSYFGNNYIIVMFPDVFRYELFETYLHGYGNAVMTDSEGIFGRKSYVKETAGGYYSCRMAVLEKLSKIKRQASILVIRLIGNEYQAPLGVWVVREATRKALKSEPMKFESKEAMINYIKLFVKEKFNYMVENILKRSKIMESINTQDKLTKFL